MIFECKLILGCICSIHYGPDMTRLRSSMNLINTHFSILIPLPWCSLISAVGTSWCWSECDGALKLSRPHFLFLNLLLKVILIQHCVFHNLITTFIQHWVSCWVLYGMTFKNLFEICYINKTT